MITDGEEQFWSIAEPLLTDPAITRSTMMGLPCLRVNGAFFASLDRKTGCLLVKLSAAHVDQLIAQGRAQAFAPAGRTFREWAAVPLSRRRTWKRLLAEAHMYVVATSA